ncbi:MAG: hypothetical protein LBV32_02130 [Tannerellaceae bacterium]|nr:hypothetical protein [Tannerellaceae bacterium]
MNRTATHRTFIRFRRWSRKGYAMFCSLGRCVTIGALKKGVADASLKKQKAPAGKMFLLPADDFEKETDEREEDTSGVLFQSHGLPVQSLTTADIYIYGIEIKTLHKKTAFAG